MALQVAHYGYVLEVGRIVWRVCQPVCVATRTSGNFILVYRKKESGAPGDGSEKGVAVMFFQVGENSSVKRTPLPNTRRNGPNGSRDSERPGLGGTLCSLFWARVQQGPRRSHHPRQPFGGIWRALTWRDLGQQVMQVGVALDACGFGVGEWLAFCRTPIRNGFLRVLAYCVAVVFFPRNLSDGCPRLRWNT
ncbi:MAG: hypothetical protein CM1200mP20_09880 [Pseudomonadota bacterium]|nr:MAG: hypothetical protein CM1200mP20_09880 [Pseudomonadota bacterium]